MRLSVAHVRGKRALPIGSQWLSGAAGIKFAANSHMTKKTYRPDSCRKSRLQPFFPVYFFSACFQPPKKVRAQISSKRQVLAVSVYLNQPQAIVFFYLCPYVT